MRKLRIEVIRALKKLVIETWEKEELDKSKAFLAKHADAIIDLIIDELKAENASPPKPCCGHKLVKENITLYKLVPTRKFKERKQ